MARIVIPGGSGYLGSLLADHLREPATGCGCST